MTYNTRINTHTHTHTCRKTPVRPLEAGCCSTSCTANDSALNAPEGHQSIVGGLPTLCGPLIRQVRRSHGAAAANQHLRLVHFRNSPELRLPRTTVACLTCCSRLCRSVFLLPPGGSRAARLDRVPLTLLLSGRWSFIGPLQQMITIRDQLLLPGPGPEPGSVAEPGPGVNSTPGAR